ncbi:Na/Pi cotransporter family protein [Neoroseomonas soli]|uniref:Na/Pi cotransporter family protein n=1 Tax=Neoroseomonas soli TaxID=1081025 RepID=A0A9X9WSY2_9PROT|nr:Na/Pi cotransporter family protein [Neoroseomonas soli]MBR0670261.1 Na/Pi cotransporter family protein [Neoroseomonas soli]
MAGIWTLIEVAGEAALLLWGLHMVQSGIMRAYGTRLRQRLGTALSNRRRGFAAGLLVTSLLQSSTATAFMVASFCAAGAVALVPGLAAMLGANVGTALIVQLFSFDVSAVAPLLILLGVVAFRGGEQSRRRDLGRASIGLGLMLLALELMQTTVAPVEHSPALRAVLAALSENPLANLLIAAVLAWAMHASVAAVLFVASLHAGGVIGADAAIAMVVGANIGSAFNPLLGGDRSDPARLRVPLGNVVNRLIGAVMVMAALPWVAAALAAVDPSPARLVANAHLAFNLVLALAAMPLLPGFARLLERVLPDRAAGSDPAAPRYLDDAALGTPPVALANAEREALRQADALEEMLRAIAAGFRSEDRDLGRRVARLNEVVDRLNRGVQAYLAALGPETLGDEERRRVAEIQTFAINLESAGDVLERSLARVAAKWAKAGVALDPEMMASIEAVHARGLEQLQLAVAAFMREDVAAARRLIEEKERMRVEEAETARRFALAAEPAAVASAGLLLEVVRDLKRVGGHLAATAHPLLERIGALRPTRLTEPPEEGLHPA